MKVCLMSDEKTNDAFVPLEGESLLESPEPLANGESLAGATQTAAQHLEEVNTADGDADSNRAADLPYLMALLALPGMGPSRLRNMLERHTAEAAWRLIAGGDIEAVGKAAKVAERLSSRWCHMAAQMQPEGVLEEYGEQGVQVARLGSYGYPSRLAEDIEPPEVLFWKGDIGILEADVTVAIVGTRTCTNYGYEVAFETGRDLAEAGISVVSGLALGIDAAAHKGALSVDGAPPVAVVGCGIDIVYPKANRKLWEEVADRGVMLSETPLGINPEPWRFPSRNRIIAALADVVLIVESLEQGGALFTAEEAAQRDVPVFAVPGPIRSPASQGTNRLLSEGCLPMCDINDLLVALGIPISGSEGRAGEGAMPQVLEPEKQALLDALGWQPAGLDQLTSRTGLSLSDVAYHIEELQAEDLVVRRGLWYERKA